VHCGTSLQPLVKRLRLTAFAPLSTVVGHLTTDAVSGRRNADRAGRGCEMRAGARCAA